VALAVANLLAASRAAGRLAQRAHDRPLDFIRWTRPQLAYLRDPSRRKLLRTGQQLGKTTAGLTEVIWRCLGQHQFYTTHPPPIEAWVVCVSWPQSVQIQKKFHSLVPKDELDPRVEFDPVKGYRGQHPIVLFKNGSIVRFKTAGQSPESLASATIHYVHIDEPCSQRVYEELQARLRRTGGSIGITLTPINGPPLPWLKTLCDEKKVSDHHYRLEPRNLIPDGSTVPLRTEDGTPMDQKFIDGLRHITRSDEANVTLDGEWETRTQDRVFYAFEVDTHRTERLPLGQTKLCLGIDHGDGDNFSQVAVLAAVDDSGEHPRIWVLDETVSDGSTTPDMDADAILEMLGRSGVEWTELDFVFGDRRIAGARGAVSKKSNADMAKAIAKRLRLSSASHLRPEIKTVKRGEGHGAGSVDHGLRFLHHAMVRPDHYHVSPACLRLIESHLKWDKSDDEWKHIHDALRYCLDAFIFGRRRAPIVAARFG
jgi:phage terminase large subunit-like protein